MQKTKPDIPPAKNIGDWSDDEFYLLLQTIPESSYCLFYKRTLSQLTESQENKLKSQGGETWMPNYLNYCVFGYLDRSFANCMKNKGIHLPKQPATEFQEYVKTTLADEDWPEPTVAMAAEDCGIQQIGQIFSRRANRFQDIDVAMSMGKQFAEMAKHSTTAIQSSDTPEMIDKKLEHATKVSCREFPSPDEFEDPVMENAVNYSIAATQYAQCVTANLCASEMNKCVAEGSSGYDCLHSSAIQQCIRRMKF